MTDLDISREYTTDEVTGPFRPMTEQEIKGVIADAFQALKDRDAVTLPQETEEKRVSKTDWLLGRTPEQQAKKQEAYAELAALSTTTKKGKTRGPVTSVAVAVSKAFWLLVVFGAIVAILAAIVTS